MQFNNDTWPTLDVDKMNKKTAQLTEDGRVIEGYEKGGIVRIVQSEDVQFFRDIKMCFTPTFVILLVHIIYGMTGNLMIVIFLANI